MSLSYSHGREFVEQARPLLESKDAAAFARFLRRYWPPSMLLELLNCGHEDAVCMALAGLSLIGEKDDCPAIALLLHSDDGATADLAEHALWSIWFRGGSETANAALATAVRLISENRLDEAAERIGTALSDSPHFAEAYHQLAILNFLRADYDAAVAQCRAALVHNPWHFGAMAGLGHCYAAMGRLDQACAAYRQALQLNPRLAGLRQAIRQTRAAVSASTGEAAPVNSFTNL
ncbi:MAG: tetratricopeptide repeat protein [Phycisphaerae bacterium]|jgi:tetratricopeptide (TPR) repeat protein